MEIKRVTIAEFTKKEEETITNFLKIRNAFRDDNNCNTNCNNCPFSQLCDLEIESIHDFQKVVTAMFQ